MIRSALLSTTLIISALPAFADGPASTDAIYACASLSTDSDRLACYDEAVGRLKAAEEAGEMTTISKAEVEEVQRDAFGFSLPSLPKLAMPKFGSSEKAELNSMVSGVSNISKPRVGGIIVTLENGQVWTQIDSTRVSYSKRKGVKEAEVKTASFGSFMMKLDGGTAFRVRRLK